MLGLEEKDQLKWKTFTLLLLAWDGESEDLQGDAVVKRVMIRVEARILPVAARVCDASVSHGSAAAARRTRATETGENCSYGPAPSSGFRPVDQGTVTSQPEVLPDSNPSLKRVGIE